MKNLIVILTCICLMPKAFADCSAVQVRKMIADGFSDSEIDKRCSSLSFNIDGQWQHMSNSKNGGVLEDWKISAGNGMIKILAFRSSQWKPLKITHQNMRGNSLKFTVKETPTLATVYDLRIVADDLMEGTFNSKDTKFKGMMPQGLISIPMDDGTIEYNGPVRLTRQ